MGRRVTLRARSHPGPRERWHLRDVHWSEMANRNTGIED